MIFSALILALIDTGIYFGIKYLSNQIVVLTEGLDASLPIAKWISQASDLFSNVLLYYVPASIIIYFVIVIFLWILLRRSFKNFEQKHDITNKMIKADKKHTGGISKKEKEYNDRRMYLYFLSLLQREGRMIDFFNEDLEQFEDDQIGAAVRKIQEDCKNTMQKNLGLKPVMDQQEGDEVDVQEGFDPNAIKLIGNVTGEPPFKGVLKHKGWKISKMDLPKLSGKQDSTLVAPAEIEIK
jgi:hypothetical protein